jgi:hypothetical protein
MNNQFDIVPTLVRVPRATLLIYYNQLFVSNFYGFSGKLISQVRRILTARQTETL